MNANQDVVTKLFAAVPELTMHHARSSVCYDLLATVLRNEIEKIFDQPASVAQPHLFGPFGKLCFPYVKMGAIDSLDLFGLDEILLFSFYWANRHRYQRCVDVGANIGLHSILLSKCGYEVRSYEPDPHHLELFKNNIQLNQCKNVTVYAEAVSSKQGQAEFVRVVGNTTSSHLAGAKDNAYGELNKFTVKLEAIENLISWADLLKIDAEGHEKEILLATTKTQWQKADALVEVGTEQNAKAIFEHLANMQVNLFAQKLNWQKVAKLSDMPTSYKEGSLFISSKENMLWS